MGWWGGGVWGIKGEQRVERVGERILSWQKGRSAAFPLSVTAFQQDHHNSQVDPLFPKYHEKHSKERSSEAGIMSNHE
jgi:hypothetical protein